MFFFTLIEVEKIKEKKFNVWTKLSADWHDEEDAGRNTSHHKQRRYSTNSHVDTPIPRSRPIAARLGGRVVVDRGSYSQPQRMHTHVDDGGSRSRSSSGHRSRSSNGHRRESYSSTRSTPVVKHRSSIFEKLDMTKSRKRGWNRDDDRRRSTNGNGDRKFSTSRGGHDSDEEWTKR